MLQFAYSTCAFLDRFLQRFQVLGQELVAFEGSPQIFEQQLVIERGTGCEAVVHAVPRTTIEHQSRILKVGQMPRYVRLRGLKDVLDVTPAKLPLKQQVQNSKPARVG